MDKSYFITGTGTGVGKTYITCSLVRQGRANTAIKPVISGLDDNNFKNSDSANILQSMNLPVTMQNIEKISPWRLKLPLSPDIAAEKEGKDIDFDDVVKFCEMAKHENTGLLIEGAGGVMTPLTGDKTMADLICSLKIPAILVTGTYLGAISHTLTAIKTLEYYSINIKYLVVNQSEDCAGAEDIIKSLVKFTNIEIIFVERGGKINY